MKSEFFSCFRAGSGDGSRDSLLENFNSSHNMALDASFKEVCCMKIEKSVLLIGLVLLNLSLSSVSALETDSELGAISELTSEEEVVKVFKRAFCDNLDQMSDLVAIMPLSLEDKAAAGESMGQFKIVAENLIENAVMDREISLKLVPALQLLGQDLDLVRANAFSGFYPLSTKPYELLNQEGLGVSHLAIAGSFSPIRELNLSLIGLDPLTPIFFAPNPMTIWKTRVTAIFEVLLPLIPPPWNAKVKLLVSLGKRLDNATEKDDPTPEEVRRALPEVPAIGGPGTTGCQVRVTLVSATLKTEGAGDNIAFRIKPFPFSNTVTVPQQDFDIDDKEELNRKILDWTDYPKAVCGQIATVSVIVIGVEDDTTDDDDIGDPAFFPFEERCVSSSTTSKELKDTLVIKEGSEKSTIEVTIRVEWRCKSS